MLSHKRGKAYPTMSKVIMGNGSFYGCLIEPQGVSAWQKGTAQTRVFLLSRSLLLNHLDSQSSKTKLLLPIMHCHVRFYTFAGQPLSKQLYIKNLEPEVIQSGPKPSRLLYFSCNMRIQKPCNNSILFREKFLETPVVLV